MKRLTKWMSTDLFTGGKGAKCSICHCDLHNQPMIVKTASRGRKGVDHQYRCWGCITDEISADLFVRSFPALFESYRDRQWTRVRIKRSLQGELFDPRYGTVNQDDLDLDFLGNPGGSK